MLTAWSKISCVTAMCLVVLVALEGASLIGSSLRFTALETEVSFWGRGSYHPTEKKLDQVDRGFAALLSANPSHPRYLGLGASAAIWKSYWASQVDEREQLAQEAITLQLASLKRRPAHRHSWAKLLEYSTRARGHGETEQAAKAGIARLRRYAVSQ